MTRRLLPVLALACGVGLGADAVALGHKTSPPGYPRETQVKCEGFYPDATPFGIACFEWDGDDMWVQDYRRNGWGVAAKVRTNYRSKGGGYYYKTRYCYNGHGAKAWHECRYDHKEGRCVRFQVYEYKRNPYRVRHGSWSHWYRTSTGATDDAGCAP
jgi:hypothetical protein